MKFFIFYNAADNDLHWPRIFHVWSSKKYFIAKLKNVARITNPILPESQLIPYLNRNRIICKFSFPLRARIINEFGLLCGRVER